MKRWLRKLFTRPGERYCTVCGAQLVYSALAERDADTGRPRHWSWSAACPESSVVFTGRGGWSGNGHARTHTLLVAAGTPTWAPVMARALTLRRAGRPGYLAGYGERLHPQEGTL